MAAKTDVKIEKTEKSEKTLIEISTLKPKQKFLNLDSGQTDELEIVSQKYDFVSYNPGTHGQDKAKFLHAVYQEALKLVQPIDKQIEALLRFAAAESYQQGKMNALKGGNYMTPEVRSRIVNFLRMYPSFSDMSASDVFEKWLEGYKSSDVKKKKMATTVLDRATASDEFADLATA